MSTAEKLFKQAQALPPQAQEALLRLAEMLAANGNASKPQPKPQFGSAKGLIKIGPEYDEPLDDFKPYTQ